MKYTKIEIDPKKMDYIEKGAGNSLSIAIAVLLAILLICGALFCKELTIDETKKELKGDPDKIALWMAQNIKAVDEDIQYGQPPAYTYKWRKGDCEDWALLSQYFIGDRYSTLLIVWQGTFDKSSKFYKKYRRRIDHTILAIFERDKFRWTIIDQDRCIRKDNAKLAELIKYNGQLRKVNIKKAFLAEIYRFHYKLIHEIDLEE